MVPTNPDEPTTRLLMRAHSSSECSGAVHAYVTLSRTEVERLLARHAQLTRLAAEDHGPVGMEFYGGLDWYADCEPLDVEDLGETIAEQLEGDEGYVWLPAAVTLPEETERVECERLSVERTYFCWSCYVKGTDIRLETEALHYDVLTAWLATTEPA